MNSTDGPSSPTLLQAQFPVVPEPECKQAFQRFSRAVIDKRVLCAGLRKGGKDACQVLLNTFVSSVTQYDNVLINFREILEDH